jgi:ankyrin repeat protein
MDGLIEACESGHLEYLRSKFKADNKGFDVNLLGHATINNRFNVVKFLVKECGINVNDKTYFCFRLKNNIRTIIKFQHQIYNDDDDIFVSDMKLSSFQIAAFYGLFEIGDFFVKNGAYLDGPFYANIPLAIACHHGNLDFVKMLVKAGCEIDNHRLHNYEFGVESDIYKPILFEIMDGYDNYGGSSEFLKIAEFLLKNGAQDQLDKYYSFLSFVVSVTPLHEANFRFTELFLNYGADPNKTRKEDSIPCLDYCLGGWNRLKRRKNARQTIHKIRLLLEAGANIPYKKFKGHPYFEKICQGRMFFLSGFKAFDVNSVVTFIMCMCRLKKPLYRDLYKLIVEFCRAPCWFEKIKQT